MAPTTASSRAARGVYFSVTRVASRPLSSGIALLFQLAAAAHLVQDDLPFHAIKEVHFHYRTRSMPWRHPFSGLDDEAQARSSHAGAEREQALERQRPDGQRLYRRRPVQPPQARRPSQTPFERPQSRSKMHCHCNPLSTVTPVRSPLIRIALKAFLNRSTSLRAGVQMPM